METRKITIVLIAILFVSLSANLQSCQASSTEQAATINYQSFLTDVFGVDLTKYNITKSGYGVSYPSSLGEKVREETLSYTLDSGQGKLSTWCLIRDGVITTCSLYPIEGQTFFARPVNLKDSLNNFMQKYQTFVSQSYKKDVSYLLQAMSSIEDVNYQTATEKTVGDMRMTVKPITDSVTSIKWAYDQDGVDLSRRHIQLKFTNGSISWFVDTWNLYTVYNQRVISKDEAQSVAFAAAQAKTISLFSLQGSNVTSVQVTPDWSNWKSEARLNLVPGAELAESIAPSRNTYPSSITRDPLTLYPIWHFIFYFGKPIGNTLGVEVGVWGDTKEVAYSNAYVVLGASEATNTPQSSDGTINNPSPTQSEYIPAITVGAIAAVLIGSCIIVCKKNRNRK